MRTSFNQRTIRRSMLALALALSVTQAGCFGSFNLTRSVWKFNKRVSHDKWIQELVFLVLAVVPVYGIAAFVDALVVNSIEFWTGRNPVNAGLGAIGDERLVRLEDGSELRMVRESENTLRAEREGEVIRIRREAGAVIVEDQSGKVLSMVREADGGAIERVDGTGTHRVEAWQIAHAGSDIQAITALAAAPAN